MHSNVHKQAILNSYRELKEIYASLFIRFFAQGMIDIFIPIYLFTIGFTLKSVIIYWILFWGSIPFFFLFARAVTHSLGAKHTVLAGVPIKILFFTLLYLISDTTAPIFLYALLQGFASSLLWYPLNIDFASSTHKKNRGKEVGYYYLAPRLGKVLAPLIGAGILAFAGFSELFIIVGILFLASTIPLFMSQELFKGNKETLHFVLTKNSVNVFFAGVVDGTITTFSLFAWPVFIFLLFNSTLQVGLASTATLLPIIFFTFLVASLSDKGQGKIILRGGAVIAAGAWFMASFVTTQFEIIALSFLAGTASIVLAMPLRRFAFDYINRTGVESGVMLREAGIWFGRMLLLVSALLAGSIFPASFIAIFMVSAVIFLVLTALKL